MYTTSLLVSHRKNGITDGGAGYHLCSWVGHSGEVPGTHSHIGQPRTSPGNRGRQEGRGVGSEEDEQTKSFPRFTSCETGSGSSSSSIVIIINRSSQFCRWSFGWVMDATANAEPALQPVPSSSTVPRLRYTPYANSKRENGRQLFSVWRTGPSDQSLP